MYHTFFLRGPILNMAIPSIESKNEFKEKAESLLPKFRETLLDSTLCTEVSAGNTTVFYFEKDVDVIRFSQEWLELFQKGTET